MLVRLRIFTSALIVSLVLAPVIVRATRAFDPSGRPTIAPSFSRSYDIPPVAAEIAPDPSVVPGLEGISRLFVPASCVFVAVVSEPDVARGPPVPVSS